MEANHRAALLLKESGNSLVARRLWTEAIHCYADGISALSRGVTHPIPSLASETKGIAIALFCNVALCTLELGRFRDTVDAATECLKLDQSNRKALHRRTQAFRALGLLCEAEEDARKLHQLG